MKIKIMNLFQHKQFVYLFAFNTILAFSIATIAIKLQLNVGLTLLVSVLVFEVVRYALRKFGLYPTLSRR